MVASAIATAIAGIAMAGASAYGSYSQSKAAQNVLGASHAFHDAGGLDLLKSMAKWRNPQTGQMDWKQMLNDLSKLSDNIGEYANTAYSYYLEDQAFQRQVQYNLQAMEQQYQYGLKNMAKQYEYDVDMQNRVFEQSRSLQNEQNAWSKMMSDTSHQREVADLRAAGLNPILSTNAGANAYSSGSAVIGGNTPQSQSVGALPVQKPSYANAMQYALEQKRVQNETAEAQARIGKINQETKNLQNTKEGLIGGVRDLIEGTDFEKSVSANILNNNGFTRLISDLKGRDYKSAIKRVINGLYNYSNPLAPALKEYSKILSNNKGRSNYDIIHTKHGDLYDIDKYIRDTYNVK